MSWLFSRAMVAAYSPDSCSVTEPSALLNVMPTQHRFWRNGKMMESSQLSQFGLTCAVLTEGHGAALLKSYLAAFPVKTLAQPARAQESTESAPVCGRTWHALSVRFNPASCEWKTAGDLLSEDLPESLVTLPRWGLMRDGECWGLIGLEPLIGVSARGFLLPTPSGCRSGKNHVVGRLDEWGGSSNPWRGTETGKTRSPSFEEWMMGWPIGWSALTPLETVRFRLWQQQHSASCQGKSEAA